ncbi:type II toxin-antitoxin system Phd/YefM family antitoxin [Haloferula sp. A504]|uniref:type II toxin-antitoxin system Phd/YefM family antitoxin n=1 Tax=Haloferula sp. A504 TaxID=3373601 RepID=UPI0031C41843|nr:type II toxin-antitoxin system prevent-host-death family antitoxin [Verrucomicrobiaceae bacterium E54]
MKRTSIRELKHETRKVLARVESGETIEVRRRNQPVAVLSPAGRRGPVEKPDFAARLRGIYGDQVLESTATDLVHDARGDR